MLIIEAVRELADSVIICSEPFAVAYGLDALLHAMIVEHNQALFEALLSAFRQKDIINGFDISGVSIGVRSKLHPDALEIFYYFTGFKMGSTVEKHVFQIMCQPLLAVGFVQ